MTSIHRLEKRELFLNLAKIAAAAFSLWQLRSRKSHRNSSHSLADVPIAPPLQAAPTESAQPTDTPKAAPATRQSSYPKALLHIVIAAAKAWSARRAASKGAAFALYTLFSLAPMLVLVVTLAGVFFGENTVRQLLVEQMSGLMGAQGAEAIKTILAGSRHENGGMIAGMVSAVLVLVSATTAFSELKDSLDELWEVPPTGKSGLWNLLRERFLSFGLILVLVLMLLASLAVSTALAALGNLWGDVASDSAFKIISLAISDTISFLIVTALFAVIFKYMPAAKIAWKDVLVGALLTAVLFTVGKFLIGMYVAHSDISSSYGAAGSVVILITWIYYSAQIFFYGALFTHEYAVEIGSRAQSTESKQQPRQHKQIAGAGAGNSLPSRAG
ncbi:YihY/virulence factor BrkB family protein [Noviherbaspirillum massiliense]|uniref:YihY/virulence factor BrkB family protein n=1 Tax=Noviherbaspirillum massiliense TaxID=1465823 RepID=UPI0002E05B18|nr:YihY/virulence factor BrkB family protein [Noviherbaspirillum massiliense]